MLRDTCCSPAVAFFEQSYEARSEVSAEAKESTLAALGPRKLLRCYAVDCIGGMQTVMHCTL